MMTVPKSIESEFIFLVFAPPYLVYLGLVVGLSSLSPLAFLSRTSALTTPAVLHNHTHSLKPHC